MFILFGFILPIVGFLITLPFKSLMAVWTIRLKAQERKEKGSLLDRLDKWATSPQSSNGKGALAVTKTASAIQATGKGSVKGLKSGVKLTVKAIRGILIALRGLLFLIRAVIICIQTVVACIGFLFSIIVVVVVVALVSIIVIMSNGGISSGSSSGSLVPTTVKYEAGDNSNWLNSVSSLGKWYTKNVTTYQADAVGDGKGYRQWYPCDIFSGKKVGDDCSAFVTACLAYAGYYPDWTSGTGWSSSSFCEGQKGYQGAILEQNFEHYKPEDYYNQPDANDTPEEIEAKKNKKVYYPKVGDIVAYPGHVEILGEIDKNGMCYAYSWGSISDVEPINRHVAIDVFIFKMWKNNKKTVTDIWQLRTEASTP